MIKKSVVKNIILGGGLALILISIVHGSCYYTSHYKSLKNCTIFNSDIINTEYAKKQYTSSISEAEIEFRLKVIAARVSLLMNTIIELDPNNEVLTSTQFTNGLLYCDWVVYGDDQIKASNTIDGKCLILNNAIDVINANSEDINVVIYNLGNNKVSYKYIWEGFNDDIHTLNQLLSKYNTSNNTKYVKIHSIRSIGE